MVKLTYIALTLFAIPFVIQPSVASTLTESGRESLQAVVDGGGDPGPFVPTCVDCNTFPLHYYKYYSGDTNSACSDIDSTKPYRKMMAVHNKYVCDNGSWWSCTYETVASECSASIVRPTCPDNTCTYL
jgi:hypothetical protein